jgi:phosphoenolpyruvate carboxykinase (ATP)
LILIGGTQYAGEIKKSIFTVLNYLLPQQDVLTMHCSANACPQNAHDVALFFGLSGTGKTTLSTDPARRLIGDDEHAWNQRGVFNLEGGCYAKVIGLSPSAEPEIYRASQRFGAILENVGFQPQSTRVNFDDDSLTENSRAAYPLQYIGNAKEDGLGAHATNIVMLTADAFGVLPPIARLTPDQAVYHFLSGYTAKVAGTEKGVREPQATFSACFGAPFMVLHPSRYARMLRERIERHNAQVWLVNTGWSGGPYGVGQRMPLPHTRAMVQSALAGELDHVTYRQDPWFGVAVPQTCPNVPTSLLDPRATWPEATEYDAQAERLLQMFDENYRVFS